MGKTLEMYGYSWDEDSKIKFEPHYMDWFNENGDDGIFWIHLYDSDNFERSSILLSIDDMITLNKFLEEKIKIAKDSGYHGITY